MPGPLTLTITMTGVPDATIHGLPLGPQAAGRGNRADRRRRSPLQIRPVRRPSDRAVLQRRRPRLLPARSTRRASRARPPCRFRRPLWRRARDRQPGLTEVASGHSTAGAWLTWGALTGAEPS